MSPYVTDFLVIDLVHRFPTYVEQIPHTPLQGPTVIITLPESYTELMKKVGHIRRPFRAQAVTIVSLCRFLADKFSAFEKSAVTIENFNSLEAYVY
jgi:hypothetical protein